MSTAAVTARRLDDLAEQAVWVCWRNEERDGRLTKVPYAADGSMARADDPATWAERRLARHYARHIVGEAGGGVGVILGIDCGDDSALGGVDLDTCRDANGELADWAAEIVRKLASYTEISPSNRGLKTFFRYRTHELPKIRELMGTQHGRMFSRRTGEDHPPAIELHVSNRYFTITNDNIDPALTELRLVEFADLEWLVKTAGPEFVGNGGARKTELGSGPRDESRSARAYRLGLRMQQAGETFEEFCEAARTDPETADWYREKGVVSDARELCRIWEKAQSSSPDGLTRIRLRGGNRPEVVEAAIAALDAAGAPFYRRGLNIVHVAWIQAKASDGRPISTPAIVTVPTQQLLHVLGKVAAWEKFDGRSKDWVPTDVPSDIAGRIAALPNEWKFQPLAGIIGTPTLRPDGSLLTEPGHDAATGYLLFDPPRMPAIPSDPSRERALSALALLDQLLDEFPFVFEGPHSLADNPSRSVALSALMTPVLRAALMPAVPLHVFRSPAGGSGKSYLCDLASAIASGERCPVLARSPSSEETEKRLIGAALLGQPIISVDNCNGELRSEFLCQAVERPVLQIRALGSSELARITNATTCFANGNNIQIAEDLVRRTIQCSLDADMERPETRESRGDPLARVIAHRGRYVAAVLTIARAYICAGMPDKPRRFMSFGPWSDLVRRSLMWLGRADPVETGAELSVADPVREVRAEVFGAIATAMPKTGVGWRVAEIIRTAHGEKAELGDALLLVADDDGRISPKRLGKWLAASENKIAGGYKLLRNARDEKRIRWQLAAVRR